jgi:hypothetical protein
VPGQFVALRLGSSDDVSAAAAGNGSSGALTNSTGAAAVLPIASSPIAARAESVNMDASVIEVSRCRPDVWQPHQVHPHMNALHTGAGQAAPLGRRAHDTEARLALRRILVPKPVCRFTT